MSWAKHDDAISAHNKALLSSLGQVRTLLSRGVSNPEMAEFYCRCLITYAKMRDSLKGNATNTKHVSVEAALRKLPSSTIILRRK